VGTGCQEAANDKLWPVNRPFCSEVHDREFSGPLGSGVNSIGFFNRKPNLAILESLGGICPFVVCAQIIFLKWLDTVLEQKRMLNW
jgi:hypothetical protein